MNRALARYHAERSDPDETFWSRVFVWRKRLYFDEVENANVWSFYLVDRDLHHTFEEWILAGRLEPYAVWSQREGRPRTTFPIAETAALYRPPVPRAGWSIDYTLEVLQLGKRSATLGMLGYGIDLDGLRSRSPSIAAMWRRVYVEYGERDRTPAPLPEQLRARLAAALAPDAKAFAPGDEA